MEYRITRDGWIYILGNRARRHGRHQHRQQSPVPDSSQPHRQHPHVRHFVVHHPRRRGTQAQSPPNIFLPGNLSALSVELRNEKLTATLVLPPRGTRQNKKSARRGNAGNSRLLSLSPAPCSP